MSKRIEDLEPITRGMCAQFLADSAAAGIPVRLTHTQREMDEQAHLYAKGRTIAGEPCTHGKTQRPVGTCKVHPLGATVTRAGPGDSPHNFGCGFDICFEGPVPYPPVDDPRWEQLGRLGDGLGLSWGGPLGEADRFTFDRPHFERRDWKTVRSATTGG